MTVSNHRKRGWCAWPRRVIDGSSKDPAYRCWENMIQRATNPLAAKSHLYYMRGISVCPRWRVSFHSFLSDMGPRPSPVHSIDRIDGDGNYEPGNCRWATPKEQANNVRRGTGNA